MMVVGRLRIQGELVQVSHWVVFFKLQLRTFLVSFYLESGEYNIVPASPPHPHRVVVRFEKGKLWKGYASCQVSGLGCLL